MMLLNLEKLFPSAGKPNVEFVALRDMRITDSGGVNRHVNTGEEFELTHEAARQIGSDDARPKTTAARPVYDDPVPSRPAVNPPPEQWKSLPKCFARFWEIEEEIRVAREHCDLIREKRIRLFGTSATLPEEGVSTILSLSLRDPKPRENYVIRGGRVDMTDEHVKFNNRALSDAAVSADDYLKRLVQTRSLEKQRAFLEISSERLKIVEEITPIIEELAVLGFEIFSCRVAGLGLSEYQNRRLYHGSADWHKYHNHGLPTQIDRTVLRYKASGEAEDYFTDPVAAQASHVLTGRQRLADLKPLLVQARKELAAAEKVLAC